MRFRIDIHLGDVIEKTNGTVYGDGVNIAARLEALAESGGVTVSDAVRTAVRGRVPAVFEDQGERAVKNIPEPVHAYAVRVGAGQHLTQTLLGWILVVQELFLTALGAPGGVVTVFT